MTVKKKPENKSIFDEMPAVTEEEAALEKKKKRARRKKVNTVLDRIAGFCIATAIVVCVGALAFDYLCVKGPSESFRNTWFNTFFETRRFGFINNLFYSEDELEEIITRSKPAEVVMDAVIDYSLINIAEEKTDANGVDAYGLVDDDGDGIIYKTLNFRGSTGYLVVVLDPKRVFLGTAQDASVTWQTNGLVLDDMVAKYNAIGGINAGIFEDDSGGGLGWPPSGITIAEGIVYQDYQTGPVAGFDSNGILYVGEYDLADCQKFGLQYACTFGPVLIANGQKMDEQTLESGVNPRTVIGQRADGAVLLLVVDGRQAYSFGLTYGDCADLLLEYGCINAMNMDGGSSTCMYYNGQLVNHPSNQAGGTRNLPTAWLFK